VTPRKRLAAIVAVFAVAIAAGVAVARHWIEDPALTRSDFVGTVEVTADDAKLYRAVPFEWRVNGPGGSFRGHDQAFLRVDPTGERTVICGWLKMDKGGQSERAARWLSQGRLKVGDLTISATFISAGDGTSAGCAGLYDNLKPAADSALALDGPAVSE
jgi:hypothetical protein